MKKYKILMDKKNTIEWEGHILYRIKALRNFGNVKKGDIGGFVESEYNLSHEGNCWIFDNAKAMDNSRIYDNSKMYNNSEMVGNSEMWGNSILKGRENLYGKLVSKVDKFIDIANPQQGRIVTGVLKNGKILYNVGCQNEITRETFINRIYNEDGGIERNPHR